MSPTAPPPVRQRPVPSRTPARPAARPASDRASRHWGRRRRRPGFRLRSTGSRLRMAAAAMAALFLLLAGRLVQLQGFKSHTYAALAEQQRTHGADRIAGAADRDVGGPGRHFEFVRRIGTGARRRA